MKTDKPQMLSLQAARELAQAGALGQRRGSTVTSVVKVVLRKEGLRSMENLG